MRRDAYSSHNSSLINQLQSQLYLPWSVGIGSAHNARGYAVLDWKNIDSNGLSRLDKLRRVAHETILRDLHAPVVAVSSSLMRSPTKMRRVSRRSVVA
jgi:hypothetical protein